MPKPWSHTSFANYSVVELARVLNLSFEDYMVPFEFTPDLVAGMMRTQGVDVLQSLLLLNEGEEAGAAMICRRGTLSRVASFGVYKKFRRQGGARYLMEAVIAAARERDDSEVELEAVIGNDGAITLYESLGFRRIRLLAGYQAETFNGNHQEIEEISLGVAAQIIGNRSVPIVPWMLAQESLAYCRRPCTAFGLGASAAIVIPQGDDRMEIKAIPLTNESKAVADTQSLLQGIASLYPSRSWHAGPFFPDELTTPLMKVLGFEKMALSQGQFRLPLK